MNLWFSVGEKTKKKNCYGLNLVITNVKCPLIEEEKEKEERKEGREGEKM